MTHVVALIHEEDGVFGISFPDFPGCVSTADSLDDAIARGAMALAFHVEGMVEDGEALPVLRSAEAIRRTEDVDGALLAAVPVDLPGRSVRVQITMDEHLLAALDRSVRASGATRSGKIAEAVRASLRA
ncbi:type II toxin-antitoxin system HicB family antitoxin [Pleomorphomonas sp. JP5]|uniref:type II toxin-antitoxin system HicB family antitoxin n=1 Tax=Pleomorphomonas sp. JP5 TaxID=2942998 RepID=UPI002043A0B2|nr:type II toxin-antitoxin system HicB family antitoxin [Pleomorphomonas sp. JP5]MCM5557272.1 type II toxin-antitoxin system HicB family antitoxin [Pleomorphomonas sp. JP5]